MSLTSKAIVLGKENFGEADRYVIFYTKEWGIIHALAKSARKSKKRYVGGLDLFCHDEISVRGNPGERPYLLELVVLNSFAGIRESLEKLLVAGRIVQWIRKLATAGAQPQVFSLLGQTLALIEKEPEESRIEFLHFIFRMKLLRYLGFSPRCTTCLRCGGSIDGLGALFDIPAGGALCVHCRPRNHDETLHLDPMEWSLLQAADQIRLTQFGTVSPPSSPPDRLLRLTTQFACYHTQVRLPV